MTDVQRLVARPADRRGRLVAIFAVAVLLPSVALSLVSLRSIPEQAEAMKITMFKQADRVLWYFERDLEAAARRQVLAAARVVGTERLLDGRPEVIGAALRQAGLSPEIFVSLRLEAATARFGKPEPRRREREIDILRDALTATEHQEPGGGGEDAVPLTGEESEVSGMLRFQLACAYAHGTLIREYFRKEFANPNHAWVVRVSEPEGGVLYETEPTPDGTFDMERVMTSPSFRGIRLQLRSRERSIEGSIRRWTLAKFAVIGGIDLMLGAGLFLVYTNVRRELELARLKSDFVANVSHELKTPLALIRLFAETLELGRVSGEDKARHYHRVINNESQRLTQLINNILDFSRIEAGRKEYRFARTDLAAVVREVVEAYRFSIEQQGFSLELHVEEDLPQVPLDREAISQALINLVNNALKYSRDEKRIRIEARRAGDGLVVAVADRGIGIARSEHHKIFEKFYRAEDSLVHETKGSGLGLSLVKHIAEAHGGRVEVDSAPGRGSTFNLWLPLERAQAT
jgi:signal transduction histidine kinase